MFQAHIHTHIHTNVSPFETGVQFSHECGEYQSAIMTTMNCTIPTRIVQWNRRRSRHFRIRSNPLERGLAIPSLVRPFYPARPFQKYICLLVYEHANKAFS